MGEFRTARIGDRIRVTEAGQMISWGEITGVVQYSTGAYDEGLAAAVLYTDQGGRSVSVDVPPGGVTQVFIEALPEPRSDQSVIGVDVRLPEWVETTHVAISGVEAQLMSMFGTVPMTGMPPAYDPATEHYHYNGCGHDLSPKNYPEPTPRETYPILDCGHEGHRGRPCVQCAEARDQRRRRAAEEKAERDRVQAWEAEQRELKRERELLDREKRIMRDFSRSDEQFRSPWYMGPAKDAPGSGDEYWDWRRKRGDYILSGSEEDKEAMLEFVTPECPPLASDMARGPASFHVSKRMAFVFMAVMWLALAAVSMLSMLGSPW